MMYVLAETSDGLNWFIAILAGLSLLISCVALISQLMQSSRKTVNSIIDARFAAYEAAQEEIQRRLGRGDQHFTDLNERDRKLETAVLGKLSDMKDWMHDTFASKDDYKQLAGRFDGFQRFISQM